MDLQDISVHSSAVEIKIEQFQFQFQFEKREKIISVGLQFQLAALVNRCLA